MAKWYSIDIPLSYVPEQVQHLFPQMLVTTDDEGNNPSASLVASRPYSASELEALQGMMAEGIIPSFTIMVQDAKDSKREVIW